MRSMIQAFLVVSAVVFVAQPSFAARGTVKWFNDSKGYGFITPDDGSEDLFAHFSAINMSGFKTLKEGQRVSYELTSGPKGKQATNIQALSPGNDGPQVSQWPAYSPLSPAPRTKKSTADPFRTAIGKCVALDDPSERLNCFDKISGRATASGSAKR